jgi:hypothetical protein
MMIACLSCICCTLYMVYVTSSWRICILVFSSRDYFVSHFMFVFRIENAKWLLFSLLHVLSLHIWQFRSRLIEMHQTTVLFIFSVVLQNLLFSLAELHVIQ